MRARTRTGFTLIELMVAMALTMFIMVILTQAFQLSLDTFSGMKGIGDMQMQLRVAEVILRDDLNQDHFEGKRRVSDMRAIPNDMTPLALPTDWQLIVRQPPQAGFLSVRRMSTASSAAPVSPNPYPPYFIEGTDANGMSSFRSNDHYLYMSVKRKGNRQEAFFTTALVGTPAILTKFFNQRTAYDLSPTFELPTATWVQPYVGGNTAFYASQWSEVLYYLVRTGSTAEPNNPLSSNGARIYSLYRAQFLMAPDATNLNQAPIPIIDPATNTALDLTTFASVSCSRDLTTSNLKFHSPADAAQGQRAVPDPVAINSASLSGNSITVTTSAAHNFTPGQSVVISGSSNAFYDSFYTIQTTPTANSFTVQTVLSGLPASAGGMAINVGVFSAATLVLPNVISFHTQVMPLGTTAFTDVPNVSGQTFGIYDTTRLGTAGATAGFPQMGLKALQVTLRVWDTKTSQTRQVTIAQDL